MKGKIIIPLLFSVIISILFFFQILSGKIPFPGDLLVGEAEPYKSYSYNGFAPGGVPNKAQGPDVIKQLIPWKKFSIESIKHGQIPFWDPYNFSGNPLMANLQSNIFYPINILFFLFDFSNAWTIYIVLAPILSIFFMYLFLDRLKLSLGASLLGGISFAFSLYMSVWMEYGNISHTLVWLPLILYFTDRFLEKPTRSVFLGIVVSGLFSVLAGYIQGFFYVYCVVSIYFFSKAYCQNKLEPKLVGLFLLALVFPVLIAAPQILPTLQIFELSTRNNYNLAQIQRSLNPIYYLVTVMIPDFFGNPASRNSWFDGTYIERVSYFGLIPLCLAIFGIISQFKKIEVKIFTFIFVFTLIISTDLFFTRFIYLIPIPVISTTIATRILCIFAFSGAVLASFGLNQIIMHKDEKKAYSVVFLLTIIIAILFIVANIYPNISSNMYMINGFSIAKRNIIIPLLSMFIFGFLTIIFYSRFFAKNIKTKKIFYTTIVLLISSLELFYYFQKITPFSPPEYLYPATPVVEFLRKEQGIDRSWGYGRAYTESNFQTYDGIFSIDGYDPLHIKEYTELLAASKNGKIPNVLPRQDANLAPGYGNQELENNPYRQKALDITGVKYVLNKDEGIKGSFSPDYTTFPEDRYRLVWQDGYWQAYQNLKVTPRLFVTNNYVVVGDKKKAIREMFGNNFDERSQILLFEDPGIDVGRSSGSAELKLYSPNKIIVDAISNKPSLLFFSDSNYPGWTATIDGQKTKIYSADYAFRAVVLNQGKHTVVFEYKSKQFMYGLYISVISLITLVFCIVFLRRSKKVYEK